MRKFVETRNEMDLQTRKISFVQEFLKLQNEEVIQSLEELLKLKSIELSNTSMEPMSIYQFHREIDESMLDSKQGRITKASALENRYSK